MIAGTERVRDLRQAGRRVVHTSVPGQRPALGYRALNLLVLVSVLLLATLAGVVVGRGTHDLLLGAAAVVGLVVVGEVLLRIELAVAVFVALEPFNDYAKQVSASAVKAIGAALFLAWLVRLMARNTPARLGHPVVRAALALTVLLLAGWALHTNGSAGTQIIIRYLSYLGALVVLIDAMQDRLTPRKVAWVFSWSCTAAALCALVHFFTGDLRAGGPLSDPNDFAFFMVAALPLTLALRRSSPHPHLYDAALALQGVALLATFSRGGLCGIAVVLVYAVATGWLSLRRLLPAFIALAVVLLGVLLVDSQAIGVSFHAKGQVAAQNVDDRLLRWEVAARMTAHNAALGLGPDGFNENYERYIHYQDNDPTHVLDVAHEMYLQVSAEFGLPALIAFLAIMGLGFAGARRASRSPGGDGELAAAVCAATLGCATAALFLTEQYYLPVWLFAALGATLDLRRRREAAG